VSKTRYFLTTFIILFGLIEVLWANSYLGPAELPLRPSKAEEGAVLSLDPSQKVVSVGDEFEVSLNLNIGGIETSGADVIISYDPNVLEVTQIRPGILFQKYPVSEAKDGKLGFSAAAVPPQTFSGKGTLAYLKFKALNPGTAFLQFAFEKGSTSDSNVVEAGSFGKDILDKVINGFYLVKD
jgi:hypothetical protein